MSDNPYDVQAGSIDPMHDGGPNRGYALNKVNGPSIGLIVVGAISVFLALFGLAMAALSMAGLNPQMATQEEQFEQLRQQGGNPQMLELLSTVTNMTQGPVSLVTNLISLVVAVIMILGALKMKRLESYGLAMTASILAVIPCFTCCVMGLPIGIWSIVVLRDQHVKQSFSSATSDPAHR